MNIKAATKYQIKEYVKSIKIFYLVIVLITIFFGTLVYVGTSGGVMTNGMESTTMIFLFILGLNSFKETFLMMLQNGITRKSMFIGRLITILVTSVSMAVIDRLFDNLIGLVSDMSERIEFSGLYEMIFPKRAGSMNIVVMNLEAILITMGIYIVAMVAGYFITTAYYRMSKMLKISVSIGVPTFLIILLPILDRSIFNDKIFEAIGRFFFFLSGGKTDNPYNLLITCLIAAVASLGFTWLLIRKAVEKN